MQFGPWCICPNHCLSRSGQGGFDSPGRKFEPGGSQHLAQNPGRTPGMVRFVMSGSALTVCCPPFAAAAKLGACLCLKLNRPALGCKARFRHEAGRRLLLLQTAGQQPLTALGDTQALTPPTGNNCRKTWLGASPANGPLGLCPTS